MSNLLLLNDKNSNARTLYNINGCKIRYFTFTEKVRGSELVDLYFCLSGISYLAVCTGIQGVPQGWKPGHTFPQYSGTITVNCHNQYQPEYSGTNTVNYHNQYQPQYSDTITGNYHHQCQPQYSGTTTVNYHNKYQPWHRSSLLLL